MSPAGRSLWVELHLLDRQIVDRDGRAVGKIDDLEFSDPQDEQDLPVARRILCGPAALGRRFGRRIGALLEALRELTSEAPVQSPAAIPMEFVADVGPAIQLTVSRDSLPVTAVERFLGEHVVGHIPGAGHAGEAERDERSASGSSS